MPVICPTLDHILASNQCEENLAGLGSVAYVFNKEDLAAPLVATENEYKLPASPFKSGKGLYKFELKEEGQQIQAESLGKRKGFKLTFDFTFEAVSKALGKTARALNNLDVCFIVPDGDDYQILYDPHRKVTFDSGALKSDTGKAAADDRITTGTATLQPVKYMGLYLDTTEVSDLDSLLYKEPGE